MNEALIVDVKIAFSNSEGGVLDENGIDAVQELIKAIVDQRSMNQALDSLGEYAERFKKCLIDPNFGLKYEQIANTDFGDLYEEDPDTAVDRIVMVLTDPDLVQLRIDFLLKIREFAEAGESKRPSVRPRYDNEIRILGEHGPLHALKEKLVTFDVLDNISRDPDTLFMAHRAIIAIIGENENWET